MMPSKIPTLLWALLHGPLVTIHANWKQGTLSGKGMPSTISGHLSRASGVLSPTSRPAARSSGS